ncbi:CopD family protein [Pseudomonadota bacterium]
MLWIKAFHIIFVVTWFAGLFYLPRLFVYHSMSVDETSLERFKVMERKLLYGIMMPSAVLASFFGIWLWLAYGFSGAWLHLKLFFVVLLIAYQYWCVKLVRQFKVDENKYGDRFYRWFNEFPALVLIVVVLLVVLKPSF